MANDEGILVKHHQCPSNFILGPPKCINMVRQWGTKANVRKRKGETEERPQTWGMAALLEWWDASRRGDMVCVGEMLGWLFWKEVLPVI